MAEASSENTLSGRDGEFVVETTRIARTTEWQVSRLLATKSEWGDSDSDGFTNRMYGRKDGTFTAGGKYDTDESQLDLFQPGDILIAVLWMNDTLYWDFPRALNTDFGLTVNIDTSEVVAWTSSWGADGVFYAPGESGATARTLPA